MLTIKQSIEYKQWQSAAEAAAVALSELPREKQLGLAKRFLRQIEKDLGMAETGVLNVDNRQLPVPPVVDTTREPPPWHAHFADARDDLVELSKQPPLDDAEFTATIAGCIWDGVMALQAIAWAATDPSDYSRWHDHLDCAGLFENETANVIAASHWQHLERALRRQPALSGRDPKDIYRPGPAMFALRRQQGYEA